MFSGQRAVKSRRDISTKRLTGKKGKRMLGNKAKRELSQGSRLHGFIRDPLQATRKRGHLYG